MKELFKGKQKSYLKKVESKKILTKIIPTLRKNLLQNKEIS